MVNSESRACPVPALRLAVRTGTFIDLGRMTLAQFLDLWLQRHASLGDPKTDESERDIPLSPVLVKALEEHRSRQQVQYRLEAGVKWKDFGLLFTQRNGGPISASNLRNRHWHPLLQRAGLRRVPSTTSATRQLR